MASSSRFEARMSAASHALLKRAAELEGRTMTDFVLNAALEAAKKTIAEAEVLSLTLADQQRFAQALSDPPPASPALHRAVKRHRQLLGDE